MEDFIKKVSRKQKEMLLSFMEEHLDFARGRLQTTEGRITLKSLWLVLTEQLNSTGTKKTVQQWQRTWTDIKIKIKRKVSDMKASQRKTGGGPMSGIKISDFEERVIKVLSEEAVFGIVQPENISFEREQPVTKPLTSVTDVTGPSGLQKRRAPESWVREKEIRETAAKTKRTRSPMSESETDEDSRRVEDEVQSPTLRESSNKSSIAAATHATNNAIVELKDEFSNINKYLHKIVQQNEQQTTQREQTNLLLERIAKALEGHPTAKKLNNKIIK